ncbi:MAG: integrin [Gammaproteobacteria bacterium]|nr:integrin [Gammaproteobacteria bacterium]
MLSILLMVACGGGGSGGGNSAPATVASPALTFTAVKTFRFSWTDITGATHYKLLENPDGISGFSQTGSDIAQGAQSIDHIVPLYARLNARYILQTCDASGCIDSATVSVAGTLVDSIGYFKASNTGTGDQFGGSVSLSADGNTLAVGAALEDSGTTGIISNNQLAPLNPPAVDSGAVYVFIRSGSDWDQQAYVKASNTGAGDQFGISVSLSEDGNTLAVGANLEDGQHHVGVLHDSSTIPADDGTGNAFGAVYVFTRTNSAWSQQVYVKPTVTRIAAGAGDQFGFSVSLSADGNILAVGAPFEDSDTSGVAIGHGNNDATDAGTVYVFERLGSRWLQEQRAQFKASNTQDNDHFGAAISLSADGNTLAVGARDEDSNAMGVDGDDSNNTAANAGAVYVFGNVRSGPVQQAYIKAGNTGSDDQFGVTVSLSADGNTLAVGANSEDGKTTGVLSGSPALAADDGTANTSGAVYVFSRSGTDWSQQAYVKASNTETNDRFGFSVSLSADGNILAIGALFEGSTAIGIGGNESNNDLLNAGAVYLYHRNSVDWSQQAYIKASNTGAEDQFSRSVSLSADGNTLAVGARNETSTTIGIIGENSNAGAVYMY